MAKPVFALEKPILARPDRRCGRTMSELLAGNIIKLQEGEEFRYEKPVIACPHFCVASFLMGQQGTKVCRWDPSARSQPMRQRTEGSCRSPSLFTARPCPSQAETPSEHTSAPSITPAAVRRAGRT